MIIGSVNPFPTIAARWFSAMAGEIAQSLRSAPPQAVSDDRAPAGAPDTGLLPAQHLSDVRAALKTESDMLRHLDEAAVLTERHLQSVSQTLRDLRDAFRRVLDGPPAEGRTAGGQPANATATVDSILDRLDELASQTTADGRPLFEGNATLVAGGHAINLEALHTRTLGRIHLEGTTFHLADLRTGRALAHRPGAALEVLDAADRTLRRTQLRLEDFRHRRLLPRLERVDHGLLRLAGQPRTVQSADQVMELAHLIRTSTLDSRTLASVHRPTDEHAVDLLI